MSITFDDGQNILTLKILDVLKKHGIKATFFFVSWNYDLQIHVDVVKRVLSEGHQIASHTHSHENLSKLSREVIIQQLIGFRNATFNITGLNPRYIRPPYGSTSPLVENVIAQTDHKSVFWSCDSADWKLKTAELIFNKIKLCDTKGMILLFHDGNNQTIKALDDYITFVRAHHPRKQFVRVDKCILWEIQVVLTYDLDNNLLWSSRG